MFEEMRRSNPRQFAELMRRELEVSQSIGSIFEASTGPMRSRPRQPSNGEMLCMRMRWDNILSGGFAHIDIHSCAEKVFIWIITKDDQSVVIEDEAALYPSDALVTKLRLMQQG